MNFRGLVRADSEAASRSRTARPTDQRISIAKLDGRTAGLIVDGASEVIRVSDEMLEPVPDLISEIGAGYVEGVVKVNDRFITLIDLRKALSDEVVAELDVVIEFLSSRRGQLATARST